MYMGKNYHNSFSLDYCFLQISHVNKNVPQVNYPMSEIWYHDEIH